MVTSIAVDVVLVVVGVVGLWLGARLFVDGAAVFARRAGLSDLVIGLTVVSAGTSLPEATVSVEAALVGSPDIAVGNVVGSNLFNIGFVLGLVALLGGVGASRALVRRDGGVLVGSALLVLAFLLDLRVSRVEGLLLLLGFAAYLALLLRSDDAPTEAVPATSSSVPRTVGALVAGLVLVVVGASVLVASASDLARLAGLSEWLIGVTVVAVGTSSPEIAASVAAARRGLGGIAAGNLVGSNVFNALGILGLTAAVHPVDVSPAALPDATWLVGLSVVVVVLFASGRRLSRPEGVLLLAATLVRWVLDAL
ncbi:calcium/sodium antiporter [Halomarina ordinaria]|uniref:Calcium/sodium antiporter n=1 Tax=Halomarina ordinaria TaxID=3033939 RepID=A0ABD5U9X3_9EURY|nr:calcium/sodium antiporter [Halomarina sp. PSRA2]